MLAAPAPFPGPRAGFHFGFVTVLDGANLRMASPLLLELNVRPAFTHPVARRPRALPGWEAFTFAEEPNWTLDAGQAG